MMRLRFNIPIVCSLVLCSASSLYADTFGNGLSTFDIEFVAVGNPGNPSDTRYPATSFGAVPYEYRIGKFEISEQQIDKANVVGNLGITHDDRGNDKPATSISWNEAARFVNWLNVSSGGVPAYKFENQPGDAPYSAQEDILLWEPGDAGYDPSNLYRNSLAKYVLPSADEWHKAAFYDPVADAYYDYPTASDSDPDGIDFADDPNFDAVFDDGGFNLLPNDVTDVGALSPYGTAGQGGNAWELEETSLDLLNDDVINYRGLRGGGFLNTPSSLHASVRNFVEFPIVENSVVGFRVASVTAVPEPTSVALVAMACIFVLNRRR